MKNIFYLFIIIAIFSSCKGYKEVAYFQDLKGQVQIDEDITKYPPIKIQRDDILDITVTSRNPEATALYNANAATSSSSSGGKTSSGGGASGYLVDQNGTIQLPSLGAVKIEGLTTAEARGLIQDKLTTYLKEPIVNLRLTNFKISIIGDVASPGVYNIQGEKVTVIEALSMAGDLNITAIRKNVLLVRENAGKRQYVRINLNEKEIFNSPYFYLQPNDALYIQPSNAKYATVDTFTRNIGIALSVISIGLVILTQF
ncbi:polysaccharide biosynthesis/export family protein [Pedobacter sp. MC2016-14]|uniref:polysaccharide biosynthesis/export family protein n=1 Tax=Pedobacter sp. MC2016-14 TaxID=2897327 RepID=UPI001E453801|nr:polysaccharide biosynthesis/export family protein [Pedobacter sp. MC2016-14]MCD0486912.1 polysaccharide biosynthesis/export family protein [Pedobacter sp. MC2016-14]